VHNLPLRLVLPLCLLPAAAALAQGERPVAVPEEAGTAALDEPIPRDPGLVTGRLENGLRYFIRANDEPANRAELRLVVDAGSILEDDDQRGLAHVVEHMAFNGTENFEKQQIVAFMELIGMRMGSDLNAGTGFDQTMYMLRVPTDNPVPLVTAFQIMADWATGISFEPEEIEQERLVVIEEWRGGQNANSRIQARQMPVILEGSRYAERQPIGTLESLQSFGRDELVRFYEDWYRPDLMAVVAVGDFDVALVEELVHQWFGDLTVPDDAPERVRYDVPDFEGTRISVATDPELPSTTLGLAYRLEEPEGDWTIGRVRRSLVEGLYGNMLTQRLAELTRESDPPFIIGIGARSDSFLNTGPAFVLTALIQGGGIERALQTLVTESERAMRFGFTEAELERTKTQSLRGIQSQYENRDSRPSALFVNQYVNWFLRGVPTPGIEYDTRLAERLLGEIALEEINAVGASWVGDSNRVVLLTAPERGDLAVPGETALLAVLDEAPGSEIEAYADSGETRELLPELPEGSPVVAAGETPDGLTEWELENGVRVILKPTDFDDDVVLLRSFSPGGLSLASDENFVPARTALRIIGNGGLGELDANALRQTMAGKLAAATPFINEFHEGINGQASPRDLETLFQLVYLWFTAPRVDQAAFDVFKAQADLFLSNRDASPATAFNDRFNEIMTQDHPRRRPETLEMLEAADAEKSLAFYRERFADAGDFTFVLVGAVDPDATRPLVERYLGALPSTGREETWRDIGVREPERIIEDTVYRGLEPAGRTRIALGGPFAIEDVDERTLHAATIGVLRSRLSDVLREDLGATYGVNVGGGTSWLPERRHSVVIEFGSDPARVDELVGVVFEEIEALRSGGPTEAEVTEAREALLRQFEVNLEQNPYWAGLITSSRQFGFDAGGDWRREYPASIEALTPERVHDGLRRFVDPESYVRLTLLPESMQPDGP